MTNRTPARRWARRRIATAAALVASFALPGAVLAQPPPSAPDPAAPVSTTEPTPTTQPTTTQPVTTVTPEGVKITRNVVMQTLPGDPPVVLTTDIYQPADNVPAPTGGRPAMVLVHGGSWFQGEPAMMDEQGILIAEQGWVGFSISYRFAKPERPSYPDAVGDVQRGVRWVGANAKTYGAEPDRIGILGASAGGHLAAMVANLGTDPIVSGPLSSPIGSVPIPEPNPPVTVRVVALWSAPLILTELVGSQGRAPFSCGSSEYCQKFWTIPLVKNLIGCELVDCREAYEQASPVNRVSEKTAPMWIANADDEIVPLGQLQLMGDALIASRVDHEVLIIEGHGHANEYTEEAWNSMVPFVADHLGVPRPQPVAFPVKGDGPGGGLTAVLALAGFLVLLLTIGVAILSRRDDDLGGGRPPSRPSSPPRPRVTVGAS